MTVLRRQIPGWTLASSLLLLGGVAAGARGDGTHANPTVAVVDGVAIDADTVRWEMVRHGADFLPRFAKLEEREAVVEELVRIEVLAQKARQEGYLDDPEIRRSLTRMLAEKYWRDQVEAMAPPAVSTADARAYYDSHRAEFTPPQKVRGAVIVLRWPSSADPAERAEKRAAAARIAAAAKGITPLAFAALVSTHSQDPATRRSGGDTGFIVEGTTLFQFEPPVVDALFAIDQVGGVVSVEGERGAYVVRLTAREGGDTAAFADVETSIRERLTRERKVEQQNERYAELRRHYDVTIDSQALSQVGPEDLSASLRPPSFPLAEQSR